MRSKRNFCSLDCSAKGRKSGQIIECFVCSRKAYKQNKALKNNQRGKFFCTRACSTKHHNSTQIGTNHPNWKYGEFVYKKKLKDSFSELPKCKLCKKNSEKILVAHHVDENRRNNKVSNLCWLCRNCHHLVHNYKTEKEKLKKVLKNDRG